ncbi:hypothetical protein Poli38472_001341 [Pythium oligandrum]|uniref:Uncharacterized protein n=1 Tax=Pythium oligandrum TaxID=41045 RepID=A0A8K1CV09_PYTOL|nr:hypothetical protein Poli38472_001341 [Pythium oligandrum]|eukprot:TMW69185.1 hypothetical protein Poli38472_001341 [Pythium oligandrum]
MSLIRQSLRALKTARTPAVALRPAQARAFSAAAPPQDNDDEVVVPELHQTLEWILTSPPPLHQFEEAPIVVETYGPVDPFNH